MQRAAVSALIRGLSLARQILRQQAYFKGRTFGTSSTKGVPFSKGYPLDSHTLKHLACAV